MSKRLFFKIGAYFLLVIFSTHSFNGFGQAKRATEERPNIILILADDLGYSDLGSYGGEIQTPNLDYLANNGVRFSQMYNTSRCCPSRASLLTGVYNHDAGIGEMTEEKPQEGYKGHLGENTATLAEVLKTAGYNTGMVGKWHVSNTIVQKDKKEQLKWLNHQASYPLFSPIEQYPTRRGFDKFYGTIWGVIDFFDPFSLVNGETPVEEVPADYYHTDAINDTTSSYIREMAKESKPFFLYVAHNAPHWPLQALPEDIEKYKDTYKVGWNAIREARFERMKSFGLIDEKYATLSPELNPNNLWEQNQDSVWDARAMAVHAAMVDRMDQGIGRIIETLKETGKLDNTIIFFLSDNGASPENCSNYGPGFDRPGETRAGVPIAYPLRKEILPGPQNTFTSIGPKWANVANTPFREAKAQSFEGGVRTPLIAFWPNGIKAKRGSISNQVGHLMDFMSTFLELAQTTYPIQNNGIELLKPEGISLLPALQGKVKEGHGQLFNEHYGAKYVRKGDWKLVAKPNGEWQLYNLANDETETKNLASSNPDRVIEMANSWQRWAAEHHVFPKP